MNKKKVLLLLSLTSTLSIAVATVFVTQNQNSVSLDSAKAGDSEYTLTYTSQAASSGNINLTTTNGNLVRFKYSSYRIDYGSFAQSSHLRVKGSAEIYNQKEDATYKAITGIQSIKINYVRCPDYINAPNVTEAGQPGDFKVQYGYVDSTNQLVYESASHDLTNNTEYDLSSIAPRYFKIINPSYCTGTNALLIQSITIKYSCVGSDASVMETLFNSKYGTDASYNSTTKVWTYGYYPQSKVTDESDLYLLADFSDSWTPCSNGYYFVKGKAFARFQAKGTGYNNEYVKDEYYWFNVEPVTWRYIDAKYDTATLKRLCYVVTSEKILDTSIFDTAGNNPTTYTTSTALGVFMNTLYSKMLPSNRDSRLYSGNLSGAPENDMYAKMFPLSYSTLYDKNSNYGFHYDSGRVAYSTDYARCNSYDLPLSGYAEDDGNISMYYWTRSFSGGNIYHVEADGQLFLTGASYAASLGVRPACRIIKP